MGKRTPFLDHGSRISPNSLAIVHLSRDNLVPVILKEDVGEVDGYIEGNVINTRFGSFPHSTLINQPWGGQIRASIVDTGSRGRKRKLKLQIGDEAGNDTEDTGSGTAQSNNVKTAASGFVHVLPPTPELWTTSLPHRTQVVYTPDYSYILHRIRARPGMKLIEAGSGSGSFTHAAVRAVFNGYSTGLVDKRGKVFSFEFNEDRFHQMENEIEAHGIKELVQITHRDVYNDGFLINGQSPEAECVFLDLPAPWKALPHLSRRKPDPSQIPDDSSDMPIWKDGPWFSPLRADRTAYLCTFSPCIEQVTRTVDAMRKLGWMEIEMVEIAHKKISVLRERVGMNMPTDRGSNQSPYDVDEALKRLREVEGRFKEFHSRTIQANKEGGNIDNTANGNDDALEDAPVDAADDDTANADVDETPSAPSFMLGRLVHRTESEIKSHTSYLVFAVLPQEWSEEQEAAALEKWPCGKENRVIGSLDKETRKQEKRELLKGKGKKKRAQEGQDGSSAKRQKKEGPLRS